MNQMEAMSLLTRIEQQWPTPRWTQGLLDDWREELEKLDAGQAGTVYARLRGRLEQRPTIAQFLAEYRQVRPYDAANPKPVCERCLNSGWVDVVDHAGQPATEAALTGLTDGYTAVKPCTCSNAAKVA